MTVNSELYPVKEHGWRQGLANLTHKENRAWWHTRKWWVQSLIWIAIINGFFAMMLWLIPLNDPEEALPPSEVKTLFIILFSVFSTIGVIVLNQSAIVGEKQSGTAEWIMSNPVSRSAFILSKLLANGLAIFLIIVVLQSALFYVQVSLFDSELLAPGPFIAAVGLVTLNLFFFLTLTLMLGTFFNSRGPVTGIAIALFIGQDIVVGILANLWEDVVWLLPQSLMEGAQAILDGQELPSVIPLIFFPLISVLFVLVAIWRFEREEF